MSTTGEPIGDRGLMEHQIEPRDFLALLVIILGSAKLFGWIARQFGQPAVLGELIAGVIVGKSFLGLVDPTLEVVHLMAELGVIVLLFAIGLETDLGKLLKVGPTSAAVAIAGVVFPFVLGYGVARAFGLPNLVAVIIGAALTATSVGITARVLSDLGQLHITESQVILGAAILDDVIGLVILGLVAGLANGKEITVIGVASTAGVAFGFLAVAIVVGRLVVPPVERVLARTTRLDTAPILGLMFAVGLAWVADRVGSAMILGAFVGGLLLVKTTRHHEVETGIARLGQFFVPIFFVSVGASVDLSSLNPFHPENQWTLMSAAALTLVAVAGKFAAGYVPVWFKGRKALIGVGMIPRGEVGLIFAQMGLRSGLLDDGRFAALTLVVMATTFLAPPWLKMLLPKVADPVVVDEASGISELSMDE